MGNRRRITACVAVAVSALAATTTAATAAAGVTGTVAVQRPAAAVSVTTAGPAGSRRAVGGHRTVHAASSTNWAGYAASSTGTTFTSVSASWIQPSATCGNRQTFSSFWVGIDGFNSNSVEQTGSEVDCSRRGAVSHFAWFEMFPAAPVNFSDPVSAGDHFNASVSTDGRGNFTLVIADTTKGWSHTQQQSSTTAVLSSAEVIAEAPSSGSTGQVLPLTNFGTVNFTGSKANGTSIGSFTPDAITMVTSNGGTKASTSALTSGQAFSVAFQHS
jgi:hypothetical protein